jgi:hypothetical protein
MPLEPFLGLGQELSAAFNTGDPHQGKLAASVNSAHVLETQEIKRFRLFAGLLQVRPHEAPKAHQPRLLFRQFQSKFPEPISQALLEPLRIAPVLEIHHEVIRKPRQVSSIPCDWLTRAASHSGAFEQRQRSVSSSASG